MAHDNLPTVIRNLPAPTHTDPAVVAPVLRSGPALSCSAPGYSAAIQVHPAASLPKLYSGDVILAIKASGMFVAVALVSGGALGNKARKAAKAT